MTFRLHRRALLRGLGGVAIGLPFLNAMESRAQAATPPKRALFMFTPCGVWQPDFWPTNATSETAFTIGGTLAPIAPHKSDLLLLKGIDNKIKGIGPGDLHQKGIAAFLTGMPLDTTPLFTAGTGSNPSVGWGTGISLDQKIANAIGATTKLPSLEVSVMRALHLNSSVISYSGPMQPISPLDDPHAAFDRCFLDFTIPPDELAAQRARRVTVLDAVLGSYNRLHARVGVEDRARLDSHVTAIRDIESRLTTLPPQTQTCAVPNFGTFPPSGVGNGNEINFPTIARLQMDILVAAMKCDITRVGSIMFSRAISPRTYKWLSVTDPDTGIAAPISIVHHSIGHGATITNAHRAALIKAIDVWHAEQFAYLVQSLKDVQESDGSRLLDNMVVVWGNELGYGPSHTHTDLPFVLAGNCQGALRTGRFLQYPQRGLAQLHVSLLNAMGLPDTTFGHPTAQAGPLPNLT